MIPKGKIQKQSEACLAAKSTHAAANASTEVPGRIRDAVLLQ